jgi:hypothetical protein
VVDGKRMHWSRVHIFALDVQSGKMVRLEQVASMSGDQNMMVNESAIYDRYLTNGALRSLRN